MDLEARHAVEQVARAEFKKALMVVTAAWKDAEFTLPEHQVPRNSAEDIQEASMEWTSERKLSVQAYFFQQGRSTKSSVKLRALCEGFNALFLLS